VKRWKNALNKDKESYVGKNLRQWTYQNFLLIFPFICSSVVYIASQTKKLNKQSVILECNNRIKMSTHTLTVGLRIFYSILVYLFVYYTTYVIYFFMYYICIESRYSHRFSANLIVTYTAVLNGPVLRSWTLLDTQMWSSVLQLRAVTPPANAMLIHLPLRHATWNMSDNFCPSLIQ
jgi:hypothetical protein